MARKARGEYVNPNEVQVLHCVQRCVRQAYLCGEDKNTGANFEHRREWIRARFQFLASVFGIDCLTYTVMSNHLHVVLRSRPDVVESWTDEEVARRWWKLFPQRKNKETGLALDPTEADLGMILNNPTRLAEVRTRLSDVSWWMRCTAENIARRANREEELSGRFWQGRYKAMVLLDEASLLACAMYVDLNPVRAALAETPEESDYTGAKDRIDDLKERGRSKRKRRSKATRDWERSRRRRRSGWLAPIEIVQPEGPITPDCDKTGRRASHRGFLELSLAKYLDLLDWTGRAIRGDKRGAIPSHLAPIFERIGVNGEAWCDLVQKFSKHFKRAAGSRDLVAAEAVRRNQTSLQAPGVAILT